MEKRELIRKEILYYIEKNSRANLGELAVLLGTDEVTVANEIAKLSADAVPMEKMESISGYLDDWENVSFEDKRQVVDALITVIRATNEKVEIEWKI